MNKCNYEWWKVYHGKKFILKIMKSLKNFKQRSDMVRFIILKGHSACSWEIYTMEIGKHYQSRLLCFSLRELVIKHLPAHHCM